MSELEEKLGTLLANPQLMQQIAAMAQTLGNSPPSSQTKEPALPTLPSPALLGNLSGLLQPGPMEPQQQELLHALSPFLSPARIGKLERAMRAARLAGFASNLLQSGGLKLPGGR